MTSATRQIGRAAVLASLATMLALPQSGLGDAGDAVPADCARPGVSHRVSSLVEEPAIGGGSGIDVVTYNIHSGLGSGFSLWKPRAEVERNLREIASDIVAAASAGEPAHVVALNEVDFGSRRSAWIDEAAFLAEQLERRTGHRYEIVRGQTWERRAIGREVRFGNALLVRLPVLASSSCLLASPDCDMAPPRDGLPSVRATGLRSLVSEERGVTMATVLVGAKPVDVLVTHLDAFSAYAREAQAMHVLHRFVNPARTTVVLGDLNAVTTRLTAGRRFFRNERTLDILTSASLSDVRAAFSARSAAAGDWATYPAAAPLWPLDAVLASVDLVPSHVSVIGRTASDHRGLHARLALLEEGDAITRERQRHDLTRSAQLERIRRCDVATGEARLRRGWLIEKTGFATLGLPAS